MAVAKSDFMSLGRGRAIPLGNESADWASGPNFCDFCESVGVKRYLPRRHKKSYDIKDALRNDARPMIPHKRMIFNLDA